MDLSESKNLIGYFEPIEMPVSELLTGTYHFSIPSYQRGYRWESGDGVNPNEESKQVDDMLNDLTNFVRDNSQKKANYYLQPLMVKPRKNQLNGWEWEVLDGQQRLTTLLLILKCLDEMLNGANRQPLYTIQYDNRKKLDFNLISFKQSNVSSYNFPLPNSNQDCYFVRKAKDRIEKWYNNEIANDTQKQDDLRKALFYPDASRNNKFSAPSLRIMFIWYNVEPIASTGSYSSDRMHDIEIFNRLNRGKISLTDSELIKALFILCLNKMGQQQSSLMSEETLVRKWDEMGQKFQDESLWSMICSRNKEYQNRLDLLFDFIRESDTTSKDKRSYLYFYKKLNPLLTTPNAQILESVWNEVKYHFDMICKWHEAVQFHNFIGYLVECGQRISQIHQKIKSSKKSSIEALKEMVKDNLALKEKNKTRSIFDPLTGEPDIDSLKYKDNYEVIKKILLFFNVATCDKYGQKFPFDYYRDYSYDIEHINSQTENPIEKIQEKKEWIINQAFPCLMEDRLEYDRTTNYWTSSANTARDLIIEGIQLLRHFKINNDIDVGEKFGGYRTKVESFYAYGKTLVPEAVISADRHSLGNLTLLNSAINREYKNALYPNKLKTLKRCDQEGVYIPLCTKYLFLKYYTNTSNTTSAFNMMRWRNEDQEDYVNSIKFTLKNAL